MSLLSGFVKTGIVLLGYIAAVVVAVLTTIFFILLPTVLPDNGAWGSFYANTKHLNLMLLGGFAVTFATAFPGFLIAPSLRQSSNGGAGFRSRLLAVSMPCFRC